MLQERELFEKDEPLSSGEDLTELTSSRPYSVAMTETADLPDPQFGHSTEWLQNDRTRVVLPISPAAVERYSQSRTPLEPLVEGDFFPPAPYSSRVVRLLRLNIVPSWRLYQWGRKFIAEYRETCRETGRSSFRVLQLSRRPSESQITSTYIRSLEDRL